MEQEPADSAPYGMYAKVVTIHNPDNTETKRLRGILHDKWSKACATNAFTVTNNIFFVCFANEGIVDLVLDQQPWFIDRNLVALIKSDHDMTLGELDLYHTRFWIQIHRVPPGWDCVPGFQSLIPQLKEVFGEVPRLEYRSLNRGFLRVRAAIYMTSPLPIGFDILRDGRPLSWADLHYEKLENFYYACGHLGHRDTHCLFDAKPLEEDGSRNYGEHMKIPSFERPPEFSRRAYEL